MRRPWSARQCRLILDLSHETLLERMGGDADGFVAVRGLRALSSRVASSYEGLTAKAISRDLNELERLGLVERRPGKVRAKKELIQAFLAPRRPLNSNPTARF
jgi:DNA-binding HxlR family transcriptional regulator